LFIDKTSGEVNIGFESFRSIPFTKKEVFEDIISAQNYFFSKKQYLESRSRRLKLITKHLDKELKKLSNKINNLQGVIEKGSREDESSLNAYLMNSVHHFHQPLVNYK